MVGRGTQLRDSVCLLPTTGASRCWTGKGCREGWATIVYGRQASGCSGMCLAAVDPKRLSGSDMLGRMRVGTDEANPRHLTAGRASGSGEGDRGRQHRQDRKEGKETDKRQGGKRQEQDGE